MCDTDYRPVVPAGAAGSHRGTRPLRTAPTFPYAPVSAYVYCALTQLVKTWCIRKFHTWLCAAPVTGTRRGPAPSPARGPP